ncbi:Beta-secretase [Phytophthora citrophthora]|uniref:Beta-secretase n=1 Tax=Phytophthora citrophthora TaxID=4793 RepID=A0AAD9G1R8_9STRA|nr:Beta-secretase [Phytophthora citrophthora]
MQVPRITALLLTLRTVQASGDILQQKLWGLSSGLAYYVEVNIGEPLYSSSSGSSSSDAFNLLLDTGSANTAVVTAECCSLTNENLYSCSDSSTCVSKGTSVSVSYVSGSWSGEVVQDTFSGQGLGTVESMPFAEITAEDSFISSGYDGIIGLGYKAIASPSSDPPTPYFDTVKSADELDNVFSLQMCGALQALSLGNVSVEDKSYLYAGEFLLGGTEGPNGESYHKGDIIYTPLVQEKYYNVIITDIGVNGESLNLDCETINSPRSIIDSGTSNLAFPSSVYSEVISELKTQVNKVMTNVPDSFFDDSTTCCSEQCDPTNANSVIYDLPGLTISLAVDEEKSKQMTITIPAEYIWRPLVVSTGQGESACRVFGISEGSFTLLGDVFMDGLFTVHDRANERVGIAVADNCPNGVTSGKNISVESIKTEDSFCDCVGSSDRKDSLLSSYVPFSSKPCYFWQWWMYVVIVAIVIIILMAIAYGYFWWKRRKLMRQLEALQNQNQPQVQRSLYTNDRLDRNLLQTPTQPSSVYIVDAFTPPQTAVPILNSGAPATTGYRLASSPSVRFSPNTTGAPATAVPGRKT